MRPLLLHTLYTFIQHEASRTASQSQLADQRRVYQEYQTAQAPNLAPILQFLPNAVLLFALFELLLRHFFWHLSVVWMVLFDSAEWFPFKKNLRWVGFVFVWLQIALHAIQYSLQSAHNDRGWSWCIRWARLWFILQPFDVVRVRWLWWLLWSVSEIIICCLQSISVYLLDMATLSKRVQSLRCWSIWQGKRGGYEATALGRKRQWSLLGKEKSQKRKRSSVLLTSAAWQMLDLSLTTKS